MGKKWSVDERRAEIIRILESRRSETMSNFAFQFGVSIRTICYDIEILTAIHPIETMRGNGGSVSGIKMEPITFNHEASKNTQLVYCNFRERLNQTPIPYGDANLDSRGKGYFLNQVTVTKQYAVVYASYTSAPAGSKYGIQIYNPNSTSVTITKMNEAFNQGDWFTMPGEVWKDYVDSSTNTSVTISPKGVYWIKDVTLNTGANFNVIQKFRTTGNVSVTAYLYKEKNAINGYATGLTYPTYRTQVSGIADTANIASSYTVRAFNLNGVPTLSDPFTKNIYHKIFGNTTYSPNNTNEVVPIRCYDNIMQNDIEQLGNWGIEYTMKVTLRNDTFSAQTFYGYAGSNSMSTCLLIKSGTSKQYYFMYGADGKATEPSGSEALNKGCRWNWARVMVPANDEKVVDFTLFHGANGNKPGYLQWSLI